MRERPRPVTWCPAGGPIGDLRSPLMAGVRFSGVTKRFGDTVAVDHVDLEIVDREFLVLLGPSGCGKSTLLRMIAGLEAPSAGTIAIGGVVVNDVAPKARDQIGRAHV